MRCEPPGFLKLQAIARCAPGGHWMIGSSNPGPRSPKKRGSSAPEGQVDLHWDLLDRPALLKGVDPWEKPPVPILGNRSLPSLPDVVHLAYLAGRGALSGWSRLKWIADLRP